MDPTTAASLGGGLIGAFIKIAAGFLMLWLKNKRDERDERMALADKQIELKKLGPDPNASFVSWTRRLLAWGVCFTFCSICILWALFPGYPIIAQGGTSGSNINLLLFTFKLSRDLGIEYTTGAIVWQLIPFMSMVLMTYFTPDISKT
jgi:hypothetical protein